RTRHRARDGRVSPIFPHRVDDRGASDGPVGPEVEVLEGPGCRHVLLDRALRRPRRAPVLLLHGDRASARRRSPARVTVSVIIVNWNAGAALDAFLASLAARGAASPRAPPRRLGVRHLHGGRPRPLPRARGLRSALLPLRRRPRPLLPRGAPRSAHRPRARGARAPRPEPERRAALRARAR